MTIRNLPRIAALALTASSPSFAAASDSIFADGFDPRLWVQGYYVGYERALLPVSEIDFGTVTHLMIGRMRPLPDGNLTYDFDIDDVQGPQWAQSAVAAAHAAGRKAVIMLGGAGEIDGWRGAAETAQKRELFVLNLQELKEAWGVNGFDLDWEPLEDADKPNFKALAQLLRARLPDAILTVPVGWFNPNYMTPDPFWAEVAPLFDRINVMTYDMAGADSQGWTGWKSWHNAALYNTDPPTGSTPSAVDVSIRLGYLAAPASVPASKLGMGLAFYGNCWQGVTGPHQDGGSISTSDGTMSYANIATQYPVATNRMWDTTARVPYLSSVAPMGPQNCNFVSYDDAQSIAGKGAYARAQHLGGVIIWTIGQGHIASLPAGQRDPLLTAVRSAFLP